MKVTFASIVSAEHRAVAISETGLKVSGVVAVRGGQVERISGGTVTTEGGITVASFSRAGAGSKDISFFGGAAVEEADILTAVSGFIAGAAEEAAEKGGEA